MEETKRDSGIELLRILSMILILFHHFSVHSNFIFNFGNLSYSKIFVDILASVGKLGVNIFIVISCYFLINSKPKLSKVILFVLEVTFYSVIMYLISVFFLNNFSYKNLLESIFPFIFDIYWFATTYIVVYIISPLINVLIENIKKKIYLRYLLILSFIFVVIPTFLYKSPEFSNLVWYVFMYFIMGFIKKYNIKLFNDYKKCKFITLFGLSIIIFTVIVFNFIGLRFKIFFEHSAYFSSINKIPSFMTSIFAFFMFKNKKLKYNKGINYISKSVFAVYLIHDNPFFSGILWEKICKNSCYYGINLVIHFVFTCSIIFMISILIDKIRVVLFEKNIMKYLNGKLEKVNVLYNKFENRIIEYI